VNRLLAWCGVDAKRYRLLTNLFRDLSDRREVMSQLGREGVSLKMAAWLYAGLSAIAGLLMVLADTEPVPYRQIFLAMTALLLFCMLFSETSNSLVNPVESIVLAHQPIDGATYVAAKLSHLARIVLYLAGAFGAPAAVMGLLLKGAVWYSVFIHLAGAYLVGLLSALLCCAIFGWLMRFVPAPRLKSAGQVAELVPWFGVMFANTVWQWFRRVRTPEWLSLPAIPRGWLIAFGLCAAVAAVVFGIRSLSLDYLVKVSSIVHGARGSASKRKRRSGLAGAVERRIGPAGRAGYEHLARMIWRDWQFRRQLIPLAPMILSFLGIMVRGLRHPPFDMRFSAAHFLPHLFGVLLFFVCSMLQYGSHPKAVWVFCLAPTRVFGRFARGIYVFLAIHVVLIPHVVLVGILSWQWGVRQALPFTLFSAAVSFFYLALELRLIQAIPFSRPPVAARNLMMLGTMMAGGVVIMVSVAVQHFVLFRHPLAVAAAIPILASAAYLVTRGSLSALQRSIRYNLGQVVDEAGPLYVEVG
jgi:hypothetical protein